MTSPQYGAGHREQQLQGLAVFALAQPHDRELAAQPRLAIRRPARPVPACSVAVKRRRPVAYGGGAIAAPQGELGAHPQAQRPVGRRHQPLGKIVAAALVGRAPRDDRHRRPTAPAATARPRIARHGLRRAARSRPSVPVAVERDEIGDEELPDQRIGHDEREIFLGPSAAVPLRPTTAPPICEPRAACSA